METCLYPYRRTLLTFNSFKYFAGDIHSSILCHLVPLAHNIKGPDVKADSEFLDKFHELIMTNKTSKLFTPYISQFKVTFEKARRSLKRRIETEDRGTREMPTVEPQEREQQDELSAFDDAIESANCKEPTLPQIGEYWAVSNGNHRCRSYMEFPL